MVIKEEHYDNIIIPPIVGMSRIRFEELQDMTFKDSLDFYNWLALLGAQQLIEETSDAELKQLLQRLIVQYSSQE